MTNSASHRVFFAGIGAAFAILFGSLLFISPADAPGYERAGVAFPDKNVLVSADIADTAEKRARGLSGRERLAPGEGMWFIFEAEGRHGFWMKDMHFAIDIIWLDERLHIVDMWEDASPESYPSIVAPKGPAKYVLEVPAGFAKMHSLAIGDRAEVSQQSE